MKKRWLVFCILGILLVAVLAGCGETSSDDVVGDDPAQAAVSIAVSIDGEDVKMMLDLAQMADEYMFRHAYSVINNWPSKKFYAAEGVTLQAILDAAGVADSFQTVTFRGIDGYEVSMTRSQALAERFYYPNLEADSEDGSEPVEIILATALAEDTTDPAAMQSCSPTLIFGQSNIYEHNSPAFVEQVSEIIVSDAPSEAWAAATTFPAAGRIAAGESVKLQHESLGLVKLYYTLDGSEPTEESTMYNPSTYQPELTKPIVIEQDTVIKVLVVGYGKENSEVVSFEFTV